MKSGIIFFLLCSIVSINVLAQTAIVKGTVRDEAGLPLELVNISVQGEAAGTRTDPKGKYTFTVPAGKRITVLYQHFSSKEKTVLFHTQGRRYHHSGYDAAIH